MSSEGEYGGSVLVHSEFSLFTVFCALQNIIT